MEYINIVGLEDLAKKKLNKNAFDYYSSGANDELSLKNNHEAFERISIYYKVLVDIQNRNWGTTVLGFPVKIPVLIAPTALHKMACEEGELATARAASRAGSIMILSSLSNTDVEEVAKASSAPLFFQLYVYKDRKVTEELIRRVENAGCKAIVVTVDAPYLGRRERDVINRFALPPGLFVKNLLPEGYGEVQKQSADSGLAAYFAELFDQSLSWKDLSWLRSVTKLPIVIKGIVRADDALHARDNGVDAIVVSNHGGRQLDTSPATIEALGPIAEALNGSVEIWLDGGVRRGTDILKALALGARAVLIGRPILWGLALDGEEGAVEVMKIFEREFDLAMALAGCAGVKDIDKTLLSPI